jgi:hypothetical protein
MSLDDLLDDEMCCPRCGLLTCECLPKCYDCGGTGQTMEGFTCAVCDGTGEVEI